MKSIKMSPSGLVPGGVSVDESMTIGAFETAVLSFSSILARCGVDQRAISTSALAKFDSIESHQKKQTLAHLEFSRQVCLEVLERPQAERSQATLLWYAIRKMGLRPTSDLFSFVRDEDVVEVYNPDFIQVFRNFKFFDISGYTISDIFVNDWRDLYQRDDSVTIGIAKEATSVFAGDHVNTFKSSTPQHHLVEIFSDERRVMDMKLQALSPLFDADGSVAALVAISRVTVLASSNFNNASSKTGIGASLQLVQSIESKEVDL